MGDKSTPAAVNGLKKQLLSAVGEERFSEALDILKVLRDQVTATQDLIRETKIGITVNKLRQSQDKAVADMAKDIIRKWKSAVSSGTKPTDKAPEKPASTASAPPDKKPEESSDPSPSGLRDSKLPPRTTDLDKVDVKTETTGDDSRDKFLKLLYDAMASDSTQPATSILSKAAELERHLHNTLPEAQYRTKLRSLYMNLKASNNPQLRARVVAGEISVPRLVTMTPQEMAPKELQDLNKQLEAENLFKAQGAAPQQAETDGFQCGKCKQRRCMYYQMQTRSADEPMTTFVTCLVCDNKWKFS